MEKLRMLEEYAKENYIPIIRKDNIEYLEKLIKENYPKSKEFLAFSLYSNPNYKEKYASYIRKLILEVANEKNASSKNLILAAKILSQGLGGKVNLVLSTKYPSGKNVSSAISFAISIEPIKVM